MIFQLDVYFIQTISGLPINLYKFQYLKPFFNFCVSTYNIRGLSSVVHHLLFRVWIGPPEEGLSIMVLLVCTISVFYLVGRENIYCFEVTVHVSVIPQVHSSLSAKYYWLTIKKFISSGHHIKIFFSQKIWVYFLSKHFRNFCIP